MGLFGVLGSDLGDWFASAFQAAMMALCYASQLLTLTSFFA